MFSLNNLLSKPSKANLCNDTDYFGATLSSEEALLLNAWLMLAVDKNMVQCSQRSCPEKPPTHIIHLRGSIKNQVIRWGEMLRWRRSRRSHPFVLSVFSLKIICRCGCKHWAALCVIWEAAAVWKYIKIDLGFRRESFKTMVIRFYTEASLSVGLILSLITFPVAYRQFKWSKIQECEKYRTAKKRNRFAQMNAWSQ